MLFLTCGFSQVSVTATLGSPGPVNYSTLKLAFDAVNAGTHQGAVTIQLTGSTTESASAVLNASGTGTSAYTAITIIPSGGVARTVSGDITGPLIDLDGADNVLIDGLNTGGNSLVISNISTANTNNTSTIRFINDAGFNSIRNLDLQGSSTSITLGTVYFSTGLFTGNSNNLVTNCNINEAAGNFSVNAIYSAGAAGFDNVNNTISNNNISNFFNPALATGGVLVQANNSSWTISGNRFFQTGIRTFIAGATHRVIQVTSGNGHVISGNIIGYATSTGTGVYTVAGAVTSRFIAIDLGVGTVSVSSVQNNTISSFNFTSSSGASTVNGIWCGINISSGTVNVGTTTGNIIGSTSGTGSVVVIGTSSGPSVVAITALSTGVLNISNNNIGGIDLLPTGVLSGTLIGIQTQGTAGIVNVTNNIIGNATPNNMRIGVIGTTTGSGIARGIININTGTINITSNTIQNYLHSSSSALGLFRGIEVQQGTGNIIDNTITNLTAYGTSASVSTQEGIGIITSSPLSGLLIEENRIFNLSLNSVSSAATVLSGIYLFSANGVTVSRNTIYNLSNGSTSVNPTAPGIISGITTRDANLAAPLTIVNNMISLGNGQTNNTAIIGVWSQLLTAGNYSLKLFYNTINIEGVAAAGSQPSFGYYRGDFNGSFTTPTVEIKNNIFTNSRSGGTGKHYAIANSYPNVTSSSTGWGANASNFNVLNANPATIGYWSGDRDFTNWKTASAGDVNSLSGLAVTYYNSASDLHLANNANAALNGTATPIGGITTDMDMDTRSVTPDIGADEFTPSTVVAINIEYFRGRKNSSVNILNWKAYTTSPSVEFDVERSIDGRKFISIGKFNASRARCALPFDFNDNAPQAGTMYYRLKIIEQDGSIYYSAVIAIINNDKGFEILGMYPTRVSSGTANLNISASRPMNVGLTVSDISGKILQKKNCCSR